MKDNRIKNNTIFLKTDVKIHKKNIENIEKQKEDKENLKKESCSNIEEHVSKINYGQESLLKLRLELRKDITSIKKEFLQKFLFLGALIFVLFIIIVYFVVKANNTSSPSVAKIGNNTVIEKMFADIAALKKNSDLLTAQLKIVADNQKILNQKVITVYESETQRMEKIDSSIKQILNYLKTEGKVIEVLSQIIMNNNVKLNKVIEKVYQPNLQIKALNSSKKNEETPETVKKKIEKETDDLINKYKNLLKELQ